MRAHLHSSFSMPVIAPVLLGIALAGCAGRGGLDPNDIIENEGPGAGIPAGTSICDTAPGRVLEVGPGKTYSVPSQAAAAARSGDTVRIAAGDYRGDVAVWYATNLRVCGVGGRARLYADGRNAQGKAIWVVAGTGMVIQNVDFHDCKVPDLNGAGIRVEPQVSLTIADSGFYDNENGILSGSGGDILIERSEFARNGHGDGYSHNIYIGRANSLTVRASFFHEAKIGHNLKSRAKTSLIENSYFIDGPNGTSSYLNDFPNGGVVTLRGNMYHKGPRADNSVAIAYGAEGLTVWPTNTLGMAHNTVVSTYPGGSFISTRTGTQAVWLNGNVFAGTNNPRLLSGALSTTSSLVHQTDNLVSTASNFPNASNVAAPSFWPAMITTLSTLYVPRVINTNYLYDSPKPYLLRPIIGTGRQMGALQSAP